MHFKELIESYKNNKVEFTEELKEVYEKYITTISSREMAASLECCVFLMTMFKEINPRSILDLGSGFSSYALRYYKESRDSNTQIRSVDSVKVWLQKSKEFCKNNLIPSREIIEIDMTSDNPFPKQKTNVDVTNFFTWNEIYYKDCPTIMYDIIFLDIDKTIERPKYLEPIFNKFTGPDTIILVDDYHKGLLRKELPPLIEKYNFDSYELKETQNRKRFQLLLKKR